jgi:hypothetical protein
MTDLISELTDVERLAVHVLEDVYRCAWSSPVLDSPQHWDRLVMRVQSAGHSSTLGRALTVLAAKLETPALDGDAIAQAIAAPDATKAEILRLWREEATALCALVRHRKDERKSRRGVSRITTEEEVLF